MAFIAPVSSTPWLRRELRAIHRRRHVVLIHFLTFRLSSQEHTAKLRANLKKAGIHADHRGNRLRFGFGLYHDTADIEELFKRLSKM